MHAILSYCGNRPTNKQTNTPTHKPRQDQLQYTALQLAHSVITEPFQMLNGLKCSTASNLGS